MKSIRKSILRMVLACLLAVLTLSCFAGCSVKPESLVLSNTTMAINVGNAQAVSCTVLPEKTTDKTIEWSSSNTAVASVSNVGVINAVSPGTCIITAKCGEVSATLSVTVKKPVEQIVLNKTNVTIKEEETFSFTYTIVPNDASETNVTWASSDNSVATVNSNGTITGVKAGTCTITAICDERSVVAEVTVKEKGPDFKKIYDSLFVGTDLEFDTAELTEFTRSTFAEVGNDNSYLTIDTNPMDVDDFSNSTALKEIQRINTVMGLPESLYSDMIRTSALMGRQHETFDSAGVEVSWTYHPDKGLAVTYKLINQ